MQMFDNINTFVKDDLKQEIRAGSKVSIAAACFSIYAYQELKEQLSEISELRLVLHISVGRLHTVTVISVRRLHIAAHSAHSSAHAAAAV